MKTAIILLCCALAVSLYFLGGTWYMYTMSVKEREEIRRENHRLKEKLKKYEQED